MPMQTAGALALLVTILPICVGIRRGPFAWVSVMALLRMHRWVSLPIVALSAVGLLVLASYAFLTTGVGTTSACLVLATTTAMWCTLAPLLLDDVYTVRLPRRHRVDVTFGWKRVRCLRKVAMIRTPIDDGMLMTVSQAGDPFFSCVPIVLRQLCLSALMRMLVTRVTTLTNTDRVARSACNGPTCRLPVTTWTMIAVFR